MSEIETEPLTHWTDKLRIGIPRDLREIRRLYANLADEAAHKYASKDMPGGAAMDLMGPVANIEAWGNRYEAAEEDGFTAAKGDDYAVDQIDAEDHPLLVLATWEDCIREERDQPTDLRATVERAADYLGRHLDWMLSDDQYGDPVFMAVSQLAADLRRVRGRLENVLNDGIRSDRGVPCMACGTHLLKVWGEQAADDRWLCKPCAKWSTPTEYNLAVAENYRRNAAALTASDIEDEYRIKPGTLRKWVHEGKVDRRGWDGSGRQLYDVEQAKALRGEPKEETA